MTRSIDVQPLTPTIGAELVGLDLVSLDRDVDDQLRALLLHHGVLVIRACRELRRADHVAFARRFGDVVDHPAGERDARCVVSIRHGPGAPPTENVWHSDSSFLASPPMGAVLRAVDVPACGGDTVFVDMRAVWQRIPASIRAVLRPLRAHHDIAKWLTEPAASTARLQHGPIEHPVVCRHPRDDAEILFVNEAYTTDVIDLCPADSDLLLSFLHRQIACPEVQCRVRWEQGTIVVWDNRTTQHYACGDYLPAVRVMERISLAGAPV